MKDQFSKNFLGLVFLAAGLGLIFAHNTRIQDLGFSTLIPLSFLALNVHPPEKAA